MCLYRKRGLTFERRYADICSDLNRYDPILTLVEANDGLGQTYEENLTNGCPSLDIERFIQNQARKAGIVNRIELALEKKKLIIPFEDVI